VIAMTAYRQAEPHLACSHHSVPPNEVLRQDD
jgi:hypothetical protein